MTQKYLNSHMSTHGRYRKVQITRGSDGLCGLLLYDAYTTSSGIAELVTWSNPLTTKFCSHAAPYPLLYCFYFLIYHIMSHVFHMYVGGEDGKIWDATEDSGMVPRVARGLAIGRGHNRHEQHYNWLISFTLSDLRQIKTKLSYCVVIVINYCYYHSRIIIRITLFMASFNY